MLQKILNNFKEISKIPRCSFREEKILKFFEDWAKEKKFEYKIDEAKNIVIYVPATKGREDDEIIILQNHMDMVCVKDKYSLHNFETDEIEIIKEGDWITANKTTLGADNGIGLAIAMYLAEIENHPSIEILITSKEEVGLIGALNLDSSMISGTKLINIDTEDLGDICISSAGGIRIDVEKEIEKQNIIHYPSEDSFNNKKFKKNIFKLFIGGMKGGHSGIEIEKNRGNAIFNLLNFLNNYSGNFEIFEIKGGITDNVIPKEIDVVIKIDDEDNFEQELDLFLKNIKNNFDAPDIFYNLEILSTEVFNPLPKINFKKIIKPILKTKVGVLEMNKNIGNLVKTSMNLGNFSIIDGIIKICYMPRSSDISKLKEIKNNILDNFPDFKIKIGEQYPGWEENPNSNFVKDILKIYKKENNGKAKIVAYHAGLECGALVEKLGGNIKTISLGPTIKGAHTTSEMCELNSVEIIGKVLKKYLEK